MEKEKKSNKLKIIVPVAIVIILAVVGIVFFTGKDGGSGETKEKVKEIKIGETFTKGEWEYTITSVEYDYILENTNAIDGKPYKDYLTPQNKDRKTDYSKIDLAKVAETGYGRNPYCSTSKDSKYALISVTCKYNGKNEIKIQPKVVFEYDGYTFEQKKSTYSVNQEKWFDSMSYLGIKPLPEKETIGYFRIATLLPTNTTENNEKPLILNFSDNGNEFKINLNNEEIPDYTK